MEVITPKNIIELLNIEFSGSDLKTPINSTERRLARSLAAAINNWKETDDIDKSNNDVLDEIATLDKNSPLSVEDELSEISTLIQSKIILMTK